MVIICKLPANKNTAGGFYLCGISMLIANTPLYHVIQSSYAFVVVEMRRIELLSEKRLLWLSPSAFADLHSLTVASGNELYSLVASAV